MINNDLDASGDYYRLFRHELVPFLGSNCGDVMDVGCGSGQLLKYLRRNGAGRTIGIELRREVAEELRASGEVDDVYCINIESEDLPLQPASLDTIIVSHVLEHMVDPWAVLRRLSRYLKDDGALVGAIPNARHVSVIGPLLFKGTWQYRSSGILDVTHLRFFTRRSIIDLLTSAGFSVEAITPEIAGPRATFVSRTSFGTLDELVAYAYNFRCRKLAGSPAPAEFTAVAAP